MFHTLPRAERSSCERSFRAQVKLEMNPELAELKKLVAGLKTMATKVTSMAASSRTLGDRIQKVRARKACELTECEVTRARKSERAVGGRRS